MTARSHYPSVTQVVLLLLSLTGTATGSSRSRQSSLASSDASGAGDRHQQVPDTPPARQHVPPEGSQTRGGHSAQSGDGYGYSRSSYRSSEMKTFSISSSSESHSSADRHRDSSRHHRPSEAAGGAGSQLSGSAVEKRRSQSFQFQASHLSRQQAGSGDRRTEADRRQHRPRSAAAAPHGDAGSSTDRASRASQAAAAAPPPAGNKLTAGDSNTGRQSPEDSRGRQPVAVSPASRARSERDRVAALTSDREDRNYYRQLFSRRCKDCTVEGKSYSGHSRFEYTEDCQRFRCICHCNGSHSCPPRYTLNICKEGKEDEGGKAVADVRDQSDLRRRRCQSCEVLGQQFEGNAYFDYQDGCTKYRGCVCYCNGTWQCPGERAINTCPQSTPAPACRACVARGKVVAANAVFELEEPCRHYRHCRCFCNGTWHCPPRFAKNTCQSPTARPQEQPGCGTCSVPGQPPVSGNTYFQRTEGCTEFKNCVCRCNGSWTCPSQYTRNTCQDAGSSGERGSAYHLPVSSAECQSCMAHGRYFRGNTYFNTRRGCTSYERCVCRCDGSWDCPSRYVTDLCADDDPTNDADNPNSTCSFCDAEGKIVPPNSFFNLTKKCVQYTQCLCHCDGGWTCPEVYARETCGGPAQRRQQGPEPERDCSSCVVDSRVVRGNSYFDFTSACFRYRDCLCKCDGTYHCQQERAENICNYSTTAAHSSPSLPPSSSSSSSSPSLMVVTAAPSCVRCLAFGQLQESGRGFVHEEDCVEYECHCHCNGTYTCPMERARRTCQPGCRECEVGGQFFEGNTYFQHAEGCLLYLCTCFCNGSYSCPPERANNTCPGGQVSEGHHSPGDPPPQASGQCQECVTSDGVRRAADRGFELHEGCIHYQCRCHCDGSWTCPGHLARNTCRGEVLGGCRSCVLSDSQIYRGGEEFQMRDGCIHYQCQCNCDGSWQCPGQKARDVCLGEVPGGCRVCRVSRNETYRGGSSFQLRQGCLHYQCQCRCNGSWECPGHTARDVCMGEVPGGCRVCKLDSGEVYLGESDFQMVKNCIHYNCRCNCDGSWQCPGERARRVCKADGSPLDVLAETTPQPTDPSCRRCVVSEAESFPSGRPFTVRRGCDVYRCQCDCDGSWHCPPAMATNVCRRRDDPGLRAGTCGRCRVSVYTYPGRSSFLLTRGCAQYTCHCDCQGRWTCDHRVARDVCQGDRQGSGERRTGAGLSLSSMTSDRAAHGDRRSLVSDTASTAVTTARGSSVAAANLGSFQVRGQGSAPCRPCRVEGRDRAPNTEFMLHRKCKRFHCYCSCNGRWRCPRNRTQDLCSDRRPDGDKGRPGLTNHLQPLTPEVAAGSRRYGRANIRVVGATSASSSSSSSSASADGSREGEQGREQLNVRGYYVNAAPLSHSADRTQTGHMLHGYKETRRQMNGHLYGQSDNRQVNGQLFGQSDNRQIDGHLYGPMNSRQIDGQLYGPVDSGQQRSEQQAGDVLAGEETVGGKEEGGVSSSGGPVEGAGDGACTPCQVDDKRYPAGAHFDWRRGCVVYRCSCLCSGSYRCRLTMDPDCRHQGASSDTGGIPTGPAVGGRPAALPGGACGNCYVQGLVYPGNMSFTLRRGCQQLRCHCGCDGRHQCADQKPIQGCVAMSTPLGNAVYPSGAASAVYPVEGGGYGSHPGRVINTFQQTYISSCPSCGQGQQGALLIPALLLPEQNPDQLPSQNPGENPGQYRYPLAAQPQHQSAASAQNAFYRSHLAYPTPEASQSAGDGQYPIGPQSLEQSNAGMSRGSNQHPMALADGVLENGEEDAMCATCFVDGQSRRGHFHYTKDCGYVSCHCDCAGRLYCSVEQTSGAQCRSQRSDLRPSDRCRTCLIHGRSHPSNSKFTLRLGCYGYVCMCGCNGTWVCPRQQPTNYCVRPPTRGQEEKPARLLLHHHPGDKAGLQDMTYSQSVMEKDSILQCQDCNVRGTTYPSRTRFLLRSDCLQHTCHCLCDGNWACANNLTINVCEQGHSDRQPNRQLPDKQKAEMAAHQDTPASQDACQDCRVKGDHFLPNAEFEFRQGCQLFICHCFCNGSWDCPSSLARNLCQGEQLLVQGQEVWARPVQNCPPCRWGNSTHVGGSNFTHTDGCWQFNCSCGCDGRVTCPASAARDLCGSADSEALTQRLREDSPLRPLPLHCTPCLVDGQLIKSRTAFSRREGCWELLCQCHCNGSTSCPPDRSLNTCQLAHDSGLTASPGAPRTGCTVGRKTYFTRLFAFRDGCVQHMCICYDSGAWRCPKGKERRLC